MIIILRTGLFLLLYSSLLAQPPKIDDYKNIKFEYHRLDSLRKTPLVICVPGFTQHNRSPEYLLLKQHFRQIGFSYLVMNPPQHGEDSRWFKKLYSWGENETAGLLALADTLGILKKHSEIHLLGFSIGAKIVLRFAASHSSIQNSIRSVIAVAAPYRVGDINMRLSGDFRKIWEGPTSGLYALDRSSFLRLAYMTLIGMSKALMKNRASPANSIGNIPCPTLLIHGSNDWLTKSYHSKKLFDLAKQDARFALVFLDTRTHAEDMLSRDRSDVRNALLETIDTWFEVVRKTHPPANKEVFSHQFETELKSRLSEDRIFSADKISLMSSPTFNDLNSNLWITPADYNHALLTVNTLRGGSENNMRHFVTVGSTKLQQAFLDQLRFGLSIQQNTLGRLSAFETYLSFYYPVGSLLWLRRISYIGGITNSFNRRILSADLAFNVLDFQVNYGKFTGASEDWQFAMNLPLISNAAATYFFGIGYSRFLSKPTSMNRDNFKVYMHLGPRLRWHNTRLQVSLQYDSNGIHDGSNDALSVGLSMSFQEK